MSMQARIASGLTALGLTPPDGAAARLAEYGRLLLEQNQVMNLTAITEPDQVADLHFLDSAALLTLGEDLRGKRLIDVGTGAGFPGLPLRILEPSLQLTLLDSLGKRVNWLASVCNTLGLEGVECLHARAEEQALVDGYRDGFDYAVSRAVASLERAVSALSEGGRQISGHEGRGQRRGDQPRRPVHLHPRRAAAAQCGLCHSRRQCAPPGGAGGEVHPHPQWLPPPVGKDTESPAVAGIFSLFCTKTH